MFGFGVVDQAVKSVQTVEEYINVGMDITNEVALDFVEGNKEECEEHISEFRKMMVKFLKMEQEIKHLQESVEFVKQQDTNTNLESTFNRKLDELRSSTDDSLLLQHGKIQDFNQRMWEALHPDEQYSAAELTNQATNNDDDIEVTQEINTKCPYTGMEMVHPVTNKHCGHNYDREGIMQYIKQRKKKARCPLGGCSNDKPIESGDLTDNKELKRYIDRMNRNAKKGKK